MTDKTKKYIIAGALGVVSIAAAAAYLQYKKIMDYVISFKSAKLKKLTPTSISLDLYLNFQNKADISYTISSQQYLVYINDVFSAKIENSSPVEILKNSTNVLPVNLEVSLASALQNLNKNGISIITNPDKVQVKIESKLKVKLWAISVPIKYTYKDSLKNMTSGA